MIYTIHSPRASGSSLVTLNLALMHQLKSPDLKVCLLQLSRYPDMPQYAGIVTPKQSLHALLAFKTLTPNLLEPLCAKKVITHLSGPTGAEWEDITLKDWKKILQLTEAHFDVLYIDLGRDVSQPLRQKVLEASSQVITVSNADIISRKTLPLFLAEHENFKSKWHLILNQVSYKKIIDLEDVTVGILASLPTENVPMHHQVYLGLPLVLQKKSKWGQVLAPAIKTLEAKSNAQ